MTAPSATYTFLFPAPWIITVTRILVLFLFTYTLVSKLSDLTLYTISMELQPFPLSVSCILVWAVPAGECVTCLLLLSDRTITKGLWLALVLMASFTVYSALVVLRFYGKTPCPCGGMIEGLSWTEHLLMNLFFLTITVISLRLVRNKTLYRNILRNQEQPNTCINQ